MSNPFIVSWWPLALADPALFHVSLQTASLDVELRARKGFTNSEILMADCVSLVRQKLNDPILALQDATMDSVVTLAAIECGKGNMEVSAMHIDGVKRLVQMRGGIDSVKCVSPLTARMVAWYVGYGLLSRTLTDSIKGLHGCDAVTAIPDTRRLWMRRWSCPHPSVV